MGVNIPPKFTQKPSLRQEGTSIVFSCEIEASPKPDITWFRGDTKLDVNANRISVKAEQVDDSTNKYTLSLIVTNVTPDDSGNYKVEAKNASGQMAANINLNLQGKTTIYDTVYVHMSGCQRNNLKCSVILLFFICSA
jgi:hypothetical protein